MPNSPTWLLYGAYGYTGKLIATLAVERGHRPLLAGRSEEKLQPLAAELNLPYRVLALDQPAEIEKTLAGLPLVLHAAGPYTHTALPMQRACLSAGAHYLDITGEITVFEQTFALDARAKEKDITLISGVGFDVVPSDCLGLYVAQQVPNADRLETAIAALSRASAGTTKSGMEILPGGNLARRAGELVEIPFGKGARRIRFVDRERTCLPFPWGDLSTSYRSTGIPNITSYVSMSRRMLPWVERFGPLAVHLMRLKPVRRLAQAWADRQIQGPSSHDRQVKRSQLWARAVAPGGEQAEAWLETSEAYHFTSLSALYAVEQLLTGKIPPGALSPAQAFGADFVLSIPGTKRMDHLPAEA